MARVRSLFWGGPLAALMTAWLLSGSACAPPQGSERGPCYGNGTCDSPLVCASDLCVQLPGNGDGDGDGDKGDGDGDGDTGDGDGDTGDGDGDFEPDVPVDDSGWVVFDPAADTITWYVSSSEGDDGNDGQSMGSPFRTLSAAMAAARKGGFPDRVLLKRGDTWVEEKVSLSGHSGRSESERFVVASYGDPSAPRPRILTGLGNGIELSPIEVHEYVAVLDLDFEAHHRNPNDPAYNPGAPGFSDNAGITATTEGQHIHFEGLRLAWFTSGMIIQNVTGGVLDHVTVRRNVVTDTYTSNDFSQGMYFYRVDHVLVEENVIDRTGAIPEVGRIGTSFDHSIYFQNGVATNNIVVRGNLFARGDGIQMREGGRAEDNLFVRTWIALHCGGGNDANPDGVSCQLHDNVILDGDNISNEQNRGWGFRIQNIEGNQSSAITGNVVANNVLGLQPLAMQLDANSIFENGIHSRIRDLLVADNAVYNWGGFFFIEGDGSSFSNVQLTGNRWENTNEEPVFIFRQQSQLDVITSSANQLWNSTSDPNTMVAVDFIPVEFSFWQSAIGDDSTTAAPLDYPDPGRTIDRYYDEELGGQGGLEAFLEQARDQQKGNWRPAYTAADANDWVRAGFGM